MARPISVLIEEVRSHHVVGKEGRVADVEDCEKRLGVNFPTDVRSFYSEVGEAFLFDRQAWRYHFLPIGEIARARLRITGSDEDADGPSLWYAFCDVGDGNYVALDIGSVRNGSCNIIDCFHETFPDSEYCQVIAHSFSEFLDRSLVSKNMLYWL